MSPQNPFAVVGRGSHIDPPNRFARLQVTEDFEHLEHDAESLAEQRAVKTEYFDDDSQSIISQNDSPDIPFRYSLNAYRGCAHGCSYCFARPTHEYLDLSAGLDFETKIFVKQKAPDLFRAWLTRPNWTAEPIMMSGVTDCYQPAERHFQLTHRCLEVALDARQPMAIVAKNALITRDLELLQQMAALRIISIAISLTSLDQSLTRDMEPRTSSPAARLRAISELTQAGVPVHAMVAPIIPGLNDHEIPAILQAARQAGAQSASYVLLRLPLTVKPVFWEWLKRARPELRERVEARIRATRGGDWYQSEFGKRMRGTGQLAEQIQRTFTVFAKKQGLTRRPVLLDGGQFRTPIPPSGQRWLFTD